MIVNGLEKAIRLPGELLVHKSGDTVVIRFGYV